MGIPTKSELTPAVLLIPEKTTFLAGLLLFVILPSVPGDQTLSSPASFPSQAIPLGRSKTTRPIPGLQKLPPWTGCQGKNVTAGAAVSQAPSSPFTSPVGVARKPLHP